MSRVEEHKARYEKTLYYMEMFAFPWTFTQFWGAVRTNFEYENELTTKVKNCFWSALERGEILQFEDCTFIHKKYSKQYPEAKDKSISGFGDWA